MNYRAYAKFPVTLLFIIAFLVTASAAAAAADSERHQRVDGMDVYLGVMPSQMTMDHPGMHSMERGMSHRYHVLVALFDSGTGKRITDATVKATVSALGLATTEQQLEPMHMGGVLSYGDYFQMSDPGRHRILIEIQRAGMQRTSRAHFIYNRPQD